MIAAREKNAGVIDIGDGQGGDSQDGEHKPPSYIEPYQGAATASRHPARRLHHGARPIANANALRFGGPSIPR